MDNLNTSNNINTFDKLKKSSNIYNEDNLKNLRDFASTSGAENPSKGDTFSIMIVGVGGQGTLLASKLMGKLLLQKGCEVKVSEVHGMSQRGGSVVTYVRFGTDGAYVFSPLVDKGEADMIISFEQLEAARWLPYLKKGGVLITGTQKIAPMPVISGKAAYPKDILAKIRALGVSLIDVDALELARECGSVRAVNMVLLGIAARFILPSLLSKDDWLHCIESTVPEKTKESNKKAFCRGYELHD